jgi:hypothetical protein
MLLHLLLLDQLLGDKEDTMSWGLFCSSNFSSVSTTSATQLLPMSPARGTCVQVWWCSVACCGTGGSCPTTAGSVVRNGCTLHDKGTPGNPACNFHCCQAFSIFSGLLGSKISSAQKRLDSWSIKVLTIFDHKLYMF